MSGACHQHTLAHGVKHIDHFWNVFERFGRDRLDKKNTLGLQPVKTLATLGHQAYQNLNFTLGSILFGC